MIDETHARLVQADRDEEARIETLKNGIPRLLQALVHRMRSVLSEEKLEAWQLITNYVYKATNNCKSYYCPKIIPDNAYLPENLEHLSTKQIASLLILYMELMEIGEPPNSLKAQTTRSREFPIRTSQDLDVFFRILLMADDRWRNNNKTLSRSCQLPGTSYFVRLSALDDEVAAGYSDDDIMTALEKLTGDQDADCIFALLYVLHLLAPPAPLPERTAPVGWVSLDDVIAKIGWNPRSTNEREKMRGKVWQYLRFGARAGVYGQRTGPTIIDKKTGKPIDTRVDGPIWVFHDRIRASLFDPRAPPLQVEISMTRAWTALITSPQTAQYLPLGELLGSIPGEQPSGAWARCIGLALANLWRRQPKAVLDETLQPTRSELLTHYTPKKAPPLEILDSTNPSFARKYWKDALQILVQNEFLANAGDAAQAVHVGGKPLPRQNWKVSWLDERVTLLPGPRMRAAVEKSAIARAFPLRSIPAKKTRRPKAIEQ